ncbi:MAG: UPF0280 family protein [Halothermotrichaceae bacterium]
MYQPRFYREQFKNDLIKKNICYKDTDLMIMAPIIKNDILYTTIRHLRGVLDNYIKDNPLFLKSMVPLNIDKYAPGIVKEMIEMSAAAGVGPMAAVAGVFAEKVGKKVLEDTDQVIVENGGDIFLKVKDGCKIGIFPGKDSPFNNKLTVKIEAVDTPLGICTSSGVMGPSYSEGSADIVTIFSHSTVLADAVATAAANRINSKKDVKNAVDWARQIEGVMGLIIIKDDNIGIWGNVELV